MRDIDRLLAARIDRRRFIQGSGLVGFSAFLAACGPGTTPKPSEAAVTGPLNFANWPAYIDLTEDETSSPTLTDFEAKYGIEVNYVEEIEANEDFYAQIATPLAAGLDTGWDIIVLTDYMAARVVRAGWVEEITAANVPSAAANIRDELKGLDWDPDMKYHYPWQSGATGVGYNVASTGRDLTKVEDLFDPAFEGKVTLLSGYADTFSLVGLLLKAKGDIANLPAAMTVEDAQAVHDYIKPFVDSGHVRAFTGNEYLQDFGSGDTWAAMVWSGDLASSGGDDDRFVYPEEGAIIWTDNMLIPKGAQHKRAAEAMIDFAYEVDNAARLAAWIYYISPVKGVSEKIAEDDPDLAANELLFPSAETAANMFPQPALADEDDVAWTDLSADLEGI